ncbi:MAG: 7-cyano-7-deazaguanine synthase QueC [Promethearchaeota archaeon]
MNFKANNFLEGQENGVQDKRVVLILSGGVDSTTLLYWLLDRKKEVFALSFDYGQKHKKELGMAKKTCEKLNVSHKVIDLSSLQIEGVFKSSALTSNKEIPEGHYTDEIMKTTVVPNRNMIMLSIAIAYAISHNCSEVYYGAHSGDHAIYPDCRPEFVKKMQEVAKICDYKPIFIKAPFLYFTKADIIKEGYRLNVDFSLTWTCYRGREKACGKCSSCIERLEAFKLNNLDDPLEYEEK